MKIMELSMNSLHPSYSPQQNGVAERKNRTLVERARSMLNSKNLQINLWAEAIATAVYLSNLSPTKAVMDRTPYEAWFGTKPNVSHLKIFGCITYTKIPVQNLQKLDNRAQKGIFVGYCADSKACRLYDPLTGKIVISRGIIFYEQRHWEWKTNTTKIHESIKNSNYC